MRPEIQIELEALITEREGMIADNKRRDQEGEYITYRLEDFGALAARIRSLRWEEAHD